MISKNAQSYCCEDLSLVEGYSAAVKSDERWDCHHRAEIVGNVIQLRKSLIKQGLYYNRPASELIFLPVAEHISLHAKNTSKLPAIGSFTRTVNSFVEHIDGLYQILNNEKITRRTLAKKLDMPVSQVQKIYYKNGKTSIAYFTERLNAVEAYLNKVRGNDNKTRVVAAALACYHECLELIQQKSK